jgi:hypothetical protein
MRAWWTVAVVVALGGCGKEATEGSNPGECTDAADNDADGFFDCDDNGCWGAPTCAGAGTTDTDGVPVGGNVDTDDDTTPSGDDTDVADTEPPEVTGDGVNADLLSFSLTYRLTIAWDANGETECNQNFDLSGGKSCDCTALYHARGQLSDVVETRNRYEGTFELVESNCARAPEQQGSALSGMSLNEASVYTSADGVMFNTWRFNSDGTEATQWVAHEDVADDTPCEPACGSAPDNGHFWVKFNRPHPVIDETTLGFDYTEHSNWFVPDILATMILDQAVSATFSKTSTPPEYPTIPE